MAACLEAAYTASPPTAVMPARDTMFTTCPPPWSRMAWIAATVPLMVPRALTSTISLRVAASCSHAGPVTRTPALLTQTSSLPARATMSSRAASTAASSRTSSTRAIAPISAAVAVAVASSTSVTSTV